jgi:hypothetical protein
MFSELDHSHISPSDWRKFCLDFPRHLIDQVIDREEAKLPDWFVPSARGVALASEELLRAAGHRPGMYRPRNWHEWSAGCFVRWMGEPHLNGRRDFLLVRASDHNELWTIERCGAERRWEVDEALVSVIGCTPIFTRSYQAAMRLATFCHERGVPGLRWFKVAPENYKLEIEIARQRRRDEACAASA